MLTPPPVPPPTSWAAAGSSGGHRPHRLGYGLLVVVVALLAAGGGSALGVHIGRDSSSAKTYRVSVATTSATTGGAAPAQGSIEAVAKAVQPAVVSVVETTSDVEGEGSGIVIDAADGYILTNNHVVSAYATEGGTLTVTTSDGRQAAAKVVGRDPTADIAVIKVSLGGLTQARLGDSTKVVVGETVVAFGSPLGLQGTVTSGIISALDRPVSTQDTTTDSSDPTEATIDALQTDAAINPGNSGGPLVDLSGDVIGVNSAIASVSDDSGSDSESGNIGVGFSIPINEAMYTADQLIKTGHAVHAVIGVTLADDNQQPTTTGAVVSAVTAGGPADKAGIQAGDVIVAVDGKVIPDADTAIVAIRANHKPGDKVKVTVKRGGSTLTFTVTLGASAPS
jgi:putative serine protease PepD